MEHLCFDFRHIAKPPCVIVNVWLFRSDGAKIQKFPYDATLLHIVVLNAEISGMDKKFEVIFPEQVIDFMTKVHKEAKAIIYYNLDKSKLGLNPKLFKKLTEDIWEFRTKYGGLQYRLFTFWDRPGQRSKIVQAFLKWAIPAWLPFPMPFTVWQKKVPVMSR